MGDFGEENEGYENVGIWAFDLLQYTDERPDSAKPGATKLNAAKRLGTPTLTEAQFRPMAVI